jgi:hypothetical protein
MGVADAILVAGSNTLVCGGASVRLHRLEGSRALRLNAQSAIGLDPGKTIAPTR